MMWAVVTLHLVMALNCHTYTAPADECMVCTSCVTKRLVFGRCQMRCDTDVTRLFIADGWRD